MPWYPAGAVAGQRFGDEVGPDEAVFYVAGEDEVGGVGNEELESFRLLAHALMFGDPAGDISRDDEAGRLRAAGWVAGV
ncbi:MAG: hypothetical protein DK306_000586 [Chloroflexi bacterium]|nr:MAG: hypothetical protein DK306_000586 [Chloroflexota bacterium]